MYFRFIQIEKIKLFIDDLDIKLIFYCYIYTGRYPD